jgi:hypothetical protein
MHMRIAQKDEMRKYTKVLLQLGFTQICVYDPKKEQIALLARGRGPIAVIEKKRIKIE